MLQFMGSQRVGQDLATEQQQFYALYSQLLEGKVVWVSKNT